MLCRRPRRRPRRSSGNTSISGSSSIRVLRSSSIRVLRFTVTEQIIVKNPIIVKSNYYNSGQVLCNNTELLCSNNFLTGDS